MSQPIMDQEPVGKRQRQPQLSEMTEETYSCNIMRNCLATESANFLLAISNFQKESAFTSFYPEDLKFIRMIRSYLVNVLESPEKGFWKEKFVCQGQNVRKEPCLNYKQPFIYPNGHKSTKYCVNHKPNDYDSSDE